MFMLQQRCDKGDKFSIEIRFSTTSQTQCVGEFNVENFSFVNKAKSSFLFSRLVVISHLHIELALLNKIELEESTKGK